MSIKCLTFDLDDTLWDCAPVLQHAEERFYIWLNKNQPHIAKKYTADMLIKHRMDYAADHPELHHDMTTLRKHWLLVLAHEFPQHPHDWIESAFNVIWIARNEVKPYIGVTDMLERLQQSFRIGAITNGNSDITLSGLGSYFDFSIHSEEAGVAKPHPYIFSLAIEKAQAQAHEIIHIGDDAIRDMVGAQQSGMKTVWVNFRNQKWLTNQPQPDVTIDSIKTMEQAILQLAHKQ